MNQFTKPNINLPVSLNDAIITSIKQRPSTSCEIDGYICFKFADGYYIVNENEVEQTGEAYVTLSGVDFDFSHVYYCKENKREEITFNQLAEDVEKNTLEVIDETYGYNQTKFSCNVMTENDWYEVEIKIYHFNQTKYEWEDNPV